MFEARGSRHLRAQIGIRRIKEKISAGNIALLGNHLKNIFSRNKAFGHKDLAKRRIDFALHIERMHQILLGNEPRVYHHPSQRQAFCQRVGHLRIRQSEVEVAHRARTRNRFNSIN